MFIQRLKQAMTDRGISQSQLARETGISKASISQYLSGKSIPRKKALETIAKVLEVEADWLVEGDCKKITVKEAAEIMGVSRQFVRVGLQQGKLPFGTAVKITGNQYCYYISPKKFSEYVGIKL